MVVFEPTTDSGIRVWQHQTLVDFGEGTVQVAEIYLFSNTESSVYIGDSFESGTVQVPVPLWLKMLSFCRVWGVENFAPIQDAIVENNIWRPKLDVLPEMAPFNC